MTRSRRSREVLGDLRSPSRVQRIAASGLLLLAVAGIATAIAWLWHLGGPLGHPPLQASQWRPWWSSREPLDAVAAMAAVVALVALAWLGAVACVHLVATFWGMGRLRLVTARLLPQVLRTLVATAALGAGPVHATAAGAAPVTAVDDTPPSMEVLDAPAPPPASAASDRGVGTGPAPPARTTEAAGAAGRLVTVRPGDHLWGIATDRVQLALGTEPAPREVHPYWSALIEVNRDRLLDPDDPDLLVPGQELVLPG